MMYHKALALAACLEHRVDTCEQLTKRHLDTVFTLLCTTLRNHNLPVCELLTLLHTMVAPGSIASGDLVASHALHLNQVPGTFWVCPVLAF